MASVWISWRPALLPKARHPVLPDGQGMEWALYLAPGMIQSGTWKKRESMAKILVVDDEPNIVKLTSFHLRRHGHEVVSADNGAAALVSANQERPDLIILDVMMPVMDGFEALRSLRGAEETREIPIIMLTCRNLDHDIAHGLMEGADLYITKPFEMDKLMLAVRRLLAVAGEAAGTTD